MGGAASLSLEGGPEKVREKLREQHEKVETLVSNIDENQKDETKNKVTRRDELDDGTIIELREDGSRYQVTPDGARLVIFENKNQLKSAQGSHLFTNPEGLFYQINPSGDTIEKRTDGTQIQLAKGGNLILAQMPDGTSLQFDFEKQVGIEIKPDGSLSQNDLKTGTVVEKTAEGVSVSTLKNGVTITNYPDGRQVDKRPDGTILDSRADGSKVQTNPDGSTIEFTVDGYRIDKDKTGKVISSMLVDAQKKQPAPSDDEDSLSEDVFEEEHASDVHAEDGEEISGDSDQFDDDFEENEVSTGPSLAAQSLSGSSSKGARADAVVLSGAVQVPKQFASKHVGSLKKMLANIPYQLGLATTSEHVEIYANGDGTLGYDLVLNREDALDMAVVKEVEAEMKSLLGSQERLYEALKRNLAADGHELKPALLARHVTGSVGKVLLPPIDTDRSWIESTAGTSEVEAAPASSTSQPPQKAKFKTLRGSVRLKGVTPVEFNTSAVMMTVLTTLLQDTILFSVQIKRSLMRVSITHSEDVTGTHSTSRINVHYRIRLQTTAQQCAEQAVDALKKTFSDKDQRKTFLATFRSKCQEQEKTRRHKRDKKKRKKKRRGKDSAASASASGHA